MQSGTLAKAIRRTRKLASIQRLSGPQSQYRRRPSISINLENPDDPLLPSLNRSPHSRRLMEGQPRHHTSLLRLVDNVPNPSDILTRVRS